MKEIARKIKINCKAIYIFKSISIELSNKISFNSNGIKDHTLESDKNYEAELKELKLLKELHLN